MIFRCFLKSLFQVSSVQQAQPLKEQLGDAEAPTELWVFFCFFFPLQSLIVVRETTVTGRKLRFLSASVTRVRAEPAEPHVGGNSSANSENVPNYPHRQRVFHSSALFPCTRRGFAASVAPLPDVDATVARGPSRLAAEVCASLVDTGEVESERKQE